MNVASICNFIEEIAPLSLQESFDNCGLLVGDKWSDVSGVLVTIDVTEAVVEEAIQKNCNLIIAHHPLIFNNLKKITGDDYVQRTITKAIKSDIAIYAAHTNMDNILYGVSGKMAEKIGLKNLKVLQTKSDTLLKLITYVPKIHSFSVREALFNAGAGEIGNYDSCSYNLDGVGTFRAKKGAQPFVGNIDELHSESEVRIEVILPSYLKNKVVDSLIKVHPYEEPAYDLIPLLNNSKDIGIGVVGELEVPENEIDFLYKIKEIFQLKSIRHSDLNGKKIKRVALCGGSGSAFLKAAKISSADIFITGDFKYHEFFDTENKIIIADIGHYESEQFTKDIFYEIITKKIPTFAVQISEIRTNPINYL